ncbi:uncharacterized protein LOC101900529 isoform X2 [Musca domestica]|uniref:Uncharacterized protein LOC101900529 isoform X2 n=1 Tax=Musca domestica TaxID=7370 RepID=A0ABM3VPE5_MUSDO|nr:uncharacterized protein LOC101900529 isoform X2 [Musca domestica]
MEDIEQLDDVFNENLEKYKRFMSYYNSREKYLSTRWLAKLKKSNATIEDRILRNRFIKYFLINQENEINIFNLEPFKALPENFNEPLTKLQHILPKDQSADINSTGHQEVSNIMELFNRLPDEGKFLLDQPIPVNGSFFVTILNPVQTISCPRPYYLSQ